MFIWIGIKPQTTQCLRRSHCFIKAFNTDRHKILLSLSKHVDGTAYRGRPTVEDMGANHIGLLGPLSVMASAGIPAIDREVSVWTTPEDLREGHHPCS
jgi:hypothetical protein